MWKLDGELVPNRELNQLQMILKKHISAYFTVGNYEMHPNVSKDCSLANFH